MVSVSHQGPGHSWATAEGRAGGEDRVLRTDLHSSLPQLPPLRQEGAQRESERAQWCQAGW